MLNYSRYSATFLFVIAGMCISASAQKTLMRSEVNSNDTTVSFNAATIASCIIHNNISADERIRDIYSWVAKNIAYDPSQLDNPERYKTTKDLVDQTLRKRKAICQGYAALFDELCRQCDIPSYVVKGYVKQDNKISDIPHAWNAAKINNTWFLFDPTWGSGSIDNSSFVPRFTFDYFKIAPEVSIKSRMPYDPVWQLLTNPFTPEEFLTGKKSENTTEPINFNDSITNYLQVDEKDRISIEHRRILAAGIANKQIADYNEYLQNTLNIIQLNKNVEKKNEIISLSNQVIESYNQSIYSYNEYIRAKNRQFKKPNYSDEQVNKMISLPGEQLEKSEQIIAGLHSDDLSLQKNIQNLSHNIAELRTSIEKDKEFVKTYCLTPVNKRISLFRTPVKTNKTHK